MLPFVFVNSILDHLLCEGTADWFCASVEQHVSINYFSYSHNVVDKVIEGSGFDTGTVKSS